MIVNEKIFFDRNCKDRDYFWMWIILVTLELLKVINLMANK